MFVFGPATRAFGKPLLAVHLLAAGGSGVISSGNKLAKLFHRDFVLTHAKGFDGQGCYLCAGTHHRAIFLGGSLGVQGELPGGHIHHDGLNQTIGRPQ